jgi:methionine-rich copper-binding protein CopC
MGLRCSMRATAVLLMMGVALAGEGLRLSDPLSGSTLKVAPRTITLNFKEAIEPHRSQFRAYRLEINPNLEPASVERAAAALTTEALAGKIKPTERMDEGALYGERVAMSVLVKLKPIQRPGVYVVLWRTFTSSERFENGFITFTYAP